jgi:hypothetical protein
VGEQFWPQVWASALGDLIGGGFVALVIGVIASEFLGLRRWAKQREEEKRREAQTALRYIELLEEEITRLAKWIPEQRQTLTESPSGYLVPIATPVWEVVRAAEELPRLVDPALLTDTADFYAILAFTRQLMELLAQTWVRHDGGGASWSPLTTDLRDSAGRQMQEAENRAQTLLELYKDEKERLAALAADATNGDGSTNGTG